MTIPAESGPTPRRRAVTAAALAATTAMLVLDVAWGVALTASAALAGKLAQAAGEESRP